MPVIMAVATYLPIAETGRGTRGGPLTIVLNNEYTCIHT